MKAALQAFGIMALLVLCSSRPRVPPAASVPVASREPGAEAHALLLGPTTAQAILAHRAVFRDNLAKVQVSTELKARWKAVRRPFTLVAVFGSWCGDSHRQLPDLLALDADPNPFVEIHYLGVGHDKALVATAWPEACSPQKVVRVPTFYLFATQPGGGQKLVGKVVETPPRDGQTMAEALVELLESASEAQSM